jgi:hypothetical protein
MHGPHDWNNPRDWARFERRMRAFGRKVERDMRRMNEKMQADMAGGDAGKPQGDRPEDRSDHRGDDPRRDPWGTAFMFEGCGADRYARRAARRAARHAARSAARGMARACGPRSFYAWWWVLIPLFFVSKNAVEDAGGWAGVGASAQSSLLSALDLTPAGPLAHLLARATGMTFTEAFAVLALSGAITAGAALIGWRMGKPARVFEPS